jgi:hypothetical protein
VLPEKLSVMDDGFKQYLETLHTSFERLVAMKPHSVDALPRIVPLECIYLFSEDLSGHPKTGQRWSGQNRPTEEAGD